MAALARGSLQFGKIQRLRFYTAWFCPYAQRAWIALEHKGSEHVEYESVEALKIDPTTQKYIKDEGLLEANPAGLVPTLTAHGGVEAGMHACVVTESLLAVEFIDELAPDGPRLLPNDAWARAHTRLFAKFVDERVCSPFYKVLVRRDAGEQAAAFASLVHGLRTFAAARDETGPCFGGDALGLVDIALAPWAYRLYLLEHYRGEAFRVPTAEEDVSLAPYHEWAEHVLAHPSVVPTLADRERLVSVYARYADGSAHSKVADAVRAGKAAHEHS